MKMVFKKALAIVLALVMALGINPVKNLIDISIVANAAYENTWINTGDQAKDIVEVAKTQIGYTEGSNNYNKYGASFNHNNVAWCAFFVSWCAKEAGISNSIIQRQGIASPFSGYFNIPNTHGRSNYFPKPGDLVFYGPNSNGDHYHVGIVETVNSSTGYITTIEGNTNSDGSSEGSVVYRHTRHYQYSRICCYGTPNYEKTTLTSPTVSTSSATYTGAQNVSINWSSISGASYYWLDIWKDGEHIFSESVNSTSYQYYCEPGSYGIYVSACNNNSTAVSDCYNFTVNSDASLSFSPSTIYMNVGETEAIAVTLNGTLPSNCYSLYEYDSNYFSHTVNGTTIYVKSLKACVMQPFSFCIYDSRGNLIAKATAKITSTKDKTLTYNANGGSGAPSSYSSTNLLVTTTISSTVPTRFGYKFIGWSTSSSATSATYVPGDSISFGDNLTLYAVWEGATTINSGLPPSAYIAFPYQCDWFKYTPTSSGTYYFESATDGLDPRITIYNSSQTQIAYDDDSGDGNNYYCTCDMTAGNTYYIKISFYSSGTGSVIHGVGKIKYTLSYNANGGSGAPSSQTGSTSYTISSTKPTRSGYTFLGWSTSSSATSATYSAGGSITLTANTTLYAVWSKNPYTVTLYSGTNKATSKTIETTGNLTFVAPASVSGWTTLGWRKDTTASTAAYSSTGSTTVSGNSTFYAVYSKPLSVTYNANGGSGAPSSQSVTRYYNSYGNYSTASLTLSSTKPTRSGYTFLGWSTSSSATSATYSAGGSITLTTNTTLYAVWSKNQPTTYTLSYNANSGSGAPSSETDSTSYTISSTVPTRFGYTFLGWSKSNSATSATYEPGDRISLSSNTTLYAVWKAATSISANTNISTTISFSYQEIYYTFTPSSNGDYIFESSGSLDSKIHLYSSSGSEIANDDDSSENGSNFKLTHSLSSGTKYYVKIRAYSSYTGSTSFVITQETPATYTLSYSANGGGGAPSSQTDATSYTISSTVPSRFGYTFLGWSKSSSATSATYEPGDSISLSSNTTLYAVWKSADNVSSGSSFNISITVPGQIYLVKITPTVSGEYTIESTGSNDTYVYLYDAGGNQLSYNDDGGENRNFSLSYDLAAGQTYYYGVKFYDSSKTGTISMSINSDNSSVAKGDVNGDGYVDATDASLVARYDAGYVTLSSTQLSVADVNKDGYVDATDASLIARYDAGYISEI